MVCSLTPLTILTSSHHRVAFPCNWKTANRAFRLWSYSYSWKYVFMLINHDSTASSCSPSKCGGLILRNYPCSSTLWRFEVCCSVGFLDRSSPSSDLSGSEWWFFSSNILCCSSLGLASGGFCCQIDFLKSFLVPSSVVHYPLVIEPSHSSAPVTSLILQGSCYASPHRVVPIALGYPQGLLQVPDPL